MNFIFHNRIHVATVEEEQILKKCKDQKIRLIPKNLSAFVPIAVKDSKSIFDYVYIEDDLLLRLTWKKRAEKQNISLLLLESTKEFEEYISQIDKQKTSIYIDSNLGENDLKGEDFAKILYEQGYQNLFIATGYEPEEFNHLPWLNFAGKKCPF